MYRQASLTVAMINLMLFCYVICSDEQLNGMTGPKDCFQFKTNDPICNQCCLKFKLIQVPFDVQTVSSCGCIEVQDSPRYAMRHKYNKVETKEEKRHCEKLTHDDVKCEVCCNERWRTPYKSALSSKCLCGKLQLYEDDQPINYITIKKSFGGHVYDLIHNGN